MKAEAELFGYFSSQKKLHAAFEIFLHAYWHPGLYQLSVLVLLNVDFSQIYSASLKLPLNTKKSVFVRFLKKEVLQNVFCCSQNDLILILSWF